MDEATTTADSIINHLRSHFHPNWRPAKLSELLRVSILNEMSLRSFHEVSLFLQDDATEADEPTYSSLLTVCNYLTENL